MDSSNKISIKRNISIVASESEVPVKKSKLEEGDGDIGNTEEDESSNEEVTPNQDEKVTDSSDKIKARAERFGGFQSDSAKKAARADRFADHLTGSDPTITNESFLDKLKKKSEKFGESPSTTATEFLDKLKKRSKKFGESHSTSETDQSEALRKRKERFGEVEKEEHETQKVKSFKHKANKRVGWPGKTEISVAEKEKLDKRKERFAKLS